MRNMLLALAALSVVALSTAVIADDQPATSVLQDNVEAAAPVAQPQPLSASDKAASTEEAAVVQKPVHNHRHTHYRRSAKQQNVFQRLMELERRKNAWLVRTFFGR